MASYGEGQSLQFRVANRRPNDLMEVAAQVLLMTVEDRDGRPIRRYYPLKLERDSVLFLALTWTVVHPIDADSPLYGLTPEDFKQRQAEFLIMLKAFDDSFSQTVFARYSYTYDEVSWGKRFAPAFRVSDAGELIIELQKLGAMTE